MENDIETNVTNSLKTEFFSKQETIDYIDNKFDTKVDKVDGFGLSANNFSDNYKNMLDDLDLSDIVRDSNYIHTDNNLTNELKNKINSMTNDVNYIGFFNDLSARDAYPSELINGYWCVINSDSDHENKKTKYYYSNEWIFDGYYNDATIILDDTSITESTAWSSKKINDELTLKANKLDTDNSISLINDKLDKKIELSNLKAGSNISIDTDQYGNATISSTSASTSTGGTTNYELLSNKPKINGISVMGNKTSKDLKLLDITYASEVNENSVKLADKAKEIDIEGQLTGSAQYYGIGNGGTNVDNTMKLRPFPVGTSTERIETLDFAILTKDVSQSIPFVREIPTVNCFVQAFKQEESELNVTDVFEDYNNELVSNCSENVICDENGLSIKDEYEINNNGINSDGFYEIKLGKFIEINDILSEVNK